MPSVEIIRFTGSHAFLTNHLILNDALEILLKAEGVIGGPYYGVQIEDKSTVYIVVIWKSREHREKHAQHPSHHGLLSCLGRARSGPLDIQHVDHFDKDVTPSLESPVTEFTTFTLKPGASRETLQATLQTFGENLEKEKTCHNVSAGESREKKGTWHVVIGWDSVQAHLDVVSQGIYPGLVKTLGEVSVGELKHASMTKYTK